MTLTEGQPVSERTLARKCLGTCAHCPKPAEAGRVNCAECRVKYNLVNKERARNWKAAGLCMKCGDPEVVTGISVCARCRLNVRLTSFRQTGVPKAEVEKARQAALVFDGICQCCGNANPKCKGKKEWAFDHDHVTMMFRGIVGTGCNAALGLAGDSSIVCTLMSEYLERHHR